jgi:surface antigen
MRADNTGEPEWWRCTVVDSIGSIWGRRAFSLVFLALMVALLAVASLGAGGGGEGALGLQGLQRMQVGQSAARVALTYRRGYSVQGAWLCYGWASGVYHCTERWRRSGGALISENTAWVPNGLSGGSATSGGAMTTVYTARTANAYPFGQCTFGAEALAHDNLNGLGNARDWFANAQRRGLPTGYSPRVGATVTFQPFVQGASWLGHVGHVVALGSGGSFEMEAMNDDAGFGRYAFRWVHVGVGVAFIY